MFFTSVFLGHNVALHHVLQTQAKFRLVNAVLCYLFITPYKLQETPKQSFNTVETAHKLQTMKEDASGQPLRNFYIKTALTCRSLGEWKNSYVGAILTLLQIYYRR